MVTCKPFIHGTLLTQAFELCKCGDSNNLSHSSLTSSSTLTTLHLLPQTNATLYAEFTPLLTPTSMPRLTNPPPMKNLPSSPKMLCLGMMGVMSHWMLSNQLSPLALLTMASLHLMVAAQLFGMEPRRCLRMSMERAMTPLMMILMMSQSLSHSVVDIVPRLGARSMEWNGSYISIVFSSYFYDDICLHNS